MRQSIQSYRFLSFSVLLTFLVVIFACDTREAIAKSQRGFLGVNVEEMTPSMRKEMKIDNRSGLLVTNVIHRSPADDAGIREEDVIVKYDGKTVDVIDNFVLLVRNTEPKSTVKVDIVRDGEDRQIEVTIGKKRRNSWSHSWHGDVSAPHIAWFGRPQLGVRVHELNDGLAEYFNGVKGGGVLILNVLEDSPAEKAGFKAGDVITKIDEEIVASPDELIEALSNYDAGEEVAVEYIRKGKKETATVQLEENAHFGENLFHKFMPKVEVHGFDKGRLREEIRVITRDRHGDVEI